VAHGDNPALPRSSAREDDRVDHRALPVHRATEHQGRMGSRDVDEVKRTAFRQHIRRQTTAGFVAQKLFACPGVDESTRSSTVVAWRAASIRGVGRLLGATAPPPGRGGRGDGEHDERRSGHQIPHLAAAAEPSVERRTPRGRSPTTFLPIAIGPQGKSAYGTTNSRPPSRGLSLRAAPFDEHPGPPSSAGDVR